MQRLRIAVIGVGADPGSRARQYLRTIVRLSDHYELVGICDRDERALVEASAGASTACFRDIGSLFASARPEVVLSMTPKDSHGVIAMTSARRGAHVITEIPVGLTRRYAKAIARTCQEHGVLWEVAEQVWLWPRERLKKMIIEAGLLGDLTHSRLWYLTGQYHGFNGVRTLLGREAKRVLGYCGEVPALPYEAYGGEPETTVMWDHAVVEFEGGIVCLFEKPPRAFPSPAQGFATGWHVEGTRGYLDQSQLVLYNEKTPRAYALRERYVEVDGCDVLDVAHVETDPPVSWENPYRKWRIGSADDVAKASILVSFHNAITTGGRPQYGHENALKDWEFCLAVRESARRGNTWVDLPLREPTELEGNIEAEFVRRYGHDPIEEPEKLLDANFTRSATLWPFAHWL